MRRPRGSSPLARGTRLRGCSTLRRVRLIPARAGNTPTTHAEQKPQPAHPRSRGEHIRAGRAPCVSIGSSPLARGTLGYGDAHDPARRLIPARAGNTSKSKPRAFVQSAHPRSRGEHAWVQLKAALALGSSPLARGTRLSSTRVLTHRRLIPARAGNTRYRSVEVAV